VSKSSGVRVESTICGVNHFWSQPFFGVTVGSRESTYTLLSLSWMLLETYLLVNSPNPVHMRADARDLTANIRSLTIRILLYVYRRADAKSTGISYNAILILIKRI